MSAQGEAIAALWRRELPTLALLDSGRPGCADGGQLGWVQRFRAHHKPGVWMISRQRGKTFAGLVDDIQLCMEIPGAIVRFAAKTAKSAKGIILPSLTTILEHCPPDIRPRIDEGSGSLVFRNGSRLVWAGVDAEQFDRLRGPRAHRLHFTEVGFWDAADLERVESALIPQLQTTGGQVLYESSPAESPGHPFIKRYHDALSHGRAEWDTIEGNPRLTSERIVDILSSEAERLGMTLDEFRVSSLCRREYYAEIVTEETRAALPGWTPERAQRQVVDSPMPPYFDGLVGLDWGGATGDPHAALFAHLEGQTVVVDDEIEVRGIPMAGFAELCKEKERALWGASRWDGTLLGLKDFKRDNIPPWLVERISAKAPRQPYLRTCDNDEPLMLELYTQCGYATVKADRHDKAIWVDYLDAKIRKGEVRINPRCKRLLEQMASGLWNKTRSSWERTAKDHNDLIDCFEAGTMILTEFGEVPVESVAVGDRVVTRDGLRDVIVSHKGRTGEIWEVETTSGRTLRGTAEHPFWTARGWVQLQNLTTNDTVYEWQSMQPNRLLLSTSTVAVTPDAQKQSSEPIGSTTGERSGPTTHFSTETSGNTITVRSLPDTTSTTETETRSTTKSQISSACPQATTRTSIKPKSEGHLPVPTGAECCRIQEQRPKSPLGEPATRAEPFTANTGRTFGRQCHIGTTSALSAAWCFRADTQAAPTSAEGAAISAFADVLGWTMSQRPANFAQQRLSETSTPPRGFAPVRVASVRTTGRSAPVFNLAVAGLNEYVANGVLVHNCLVYIARHAPYGRNPEPAPRLDAWQRGILELRQEASGQKGLKDLFRRR